MNPISRVVTIILAASLLISIFELIRRRKLKERYAFLWLITGSIILLFATCQKLLFGFIGMLGIQLPINGILFLGVFFLITINLHFSLIISKLGEQNKILAQKIALLEADIRGRDDG